jgi:hypothetical protein
MVAAENNYQSFLVGETVQALSLAIDSFQVKIDRERTEWKSD